MSIGKQGIRVDSLFYICLSQFSVCWLYLDFYFIGVGAIDERYLKKLFLYRTFE